MVHARYDCALKISWVSIYCLEKPRLVPISFSLLQVFEVYKNQKFGTPYQHVMDATDSCFEVPAWSNEEKLAALEGDAVVVVAVVDDFHLLALPTTEVGTNVDFLG